ncbi:MULTISPECIES: high-affinity branched-chain amino acid ABC transporter permease LivM [Limibacillus]|jgi:branched-chain amino acid transport system permease protein|uniref:Branched-chain amino acid transport system permease protein n=1 Tax=Limibacillus halophilus TaxID=1579333 RepID=A0A839SRS5_9PROT|nr:high-affinity branched-chain amino acid ABC transporter permease LivM [Limibacillus halophilus]MBB3065008.1 branched-chain amino acid transport system permease protein [Limibacillus halophilus]
MARQPVERTPLDFSEIGRELGLTAVVGLGLTIPLLSLKTVDDVGGLQIVGRWTETALVILLLVLGRFGLILLRETGREIPVVLGGGLMGLVGLLDLLRNQLSAMTGGEPWDGIFPSYTLAFLAGAGGAILALRAGMQLSRRYSNLTRGERDARAEARAETFRGFITLLAALAVVMAVILPFMPFSNRYVIDVATLIVTYVMLGWGLNIIVGYAGLLDLGYVAFYAVGAYSYALGAQYLGVSFWLALPFAGILAASFGLILGFPVLRLRGDYFAIVTLGFGEIVRIILINWYPVTKGPDGLSGIPRPDFFGLAVFSRNAIDGLPPFHEFFGLEYASEHRIYFLYYLILIMASLVAIFTLRIRRLPIGRAWEALREDDIACASLGINRTTIKLAAFAISAAWGGLAGAFFATRQGFISPESFTFIESAIILAIVVMGGMGSLVGIACAAILLIGLPEVFRELAEYRMVAFGAGLVFIMIWRPQGLLSHREPSVLLHGKDGRGGMKPAADPAAALAEATKESAS